LRIEEKLVRNYIVEKGMGRNLPEKIYFWDETMRDGEQTPGVYFSPEEKLEIATLMDEMGIHIMNVGIPVVSKEEARAVKLIADANLDASIMTAARAVRKDVDACIESGCDEISIFIACSDLHLKYKLQMTREQVIDAAVKEVEYAKDHGLKVSFVTEDTFRADLDYVVQLYNSCIEAGAERAVICDTVGIMVPSGVKWFFEQIKRRFKPVQLSIHCHNDFGLGVANTIAGLENGVEVPHTCVNGIGERSGNASFEELVMSLESLYGYNTGIDISRLYELSKLVEKYSGIPLAVNKPIVGYNAFSHESGIHADGVLKHTLTYEPIQPEQIGRQRRIVFGKHTGAAAVIDKLRREGIEVSKEKLGEIVEAIKVKAETRRKEEQMAFIKEFRDREEKRSGVSEEEFWEIVKRCGVQLPK